MIPYVVIIAIVWIILFVALVPAGAAARARVSGPGLTVGAAGQVAAVSDIAITFAVIAALVVLFVWGRLPVEVVAIGAALALWATGVLTLQQSPGRVRRPGRHLHRDAVRRQRGARLRPGSRRGPASS